MVSGWKWTTNEVAAGQSAGLCVVDPDLVNYASCWLLTRDAQNGWASKRSFLIDPTKLNADLVLENQEEFDTTQDLYPGFFGSW